MDVNNLVPNDMGVVALPYLINGSVPQEALVGLQTVGVTEEAQWIPDSSTVLLTFSTVNSIPLDKTQEQDVSGTTLYPYVPNVYITEDGALIAEPIDGSPLTIVDPTIAADSPQTISDCEPNTAPDCRPILETFLQTVSQENSPLPVDDIGHVAVIGDIPSPKGSGVDDFLEVKTVLSCRLCQYQCDDRQEFANHVLKNHKPKSVKPKDKPQRRREISKIKSKKKDQLQLNGQEKIKGVSKIKEDNGRTTTNVFFSCGSCQKVTTSLDELSEHMMTIHGNNKVKIEDGVLDSDMETDTENNVVEVISSTVETTETAGPTQEEVASESRVKSNVPQEIVYKLGGVDPNQLVIKCECRVKFSTKSNLETHRKCHSQDGKLWKFKCFICHGTYKRWSYCSNHLWQAHKLNIDLYTCSICQYKTALRDKYINHEQHHRREKVFSCGLCNKTFSQRAQLSNHSVIHKKKNSDAKVPEWAKPKVCDLCQKTFCDLKSLKKHVKMIHSKLKPYVCQVCGHCSANKHMFQLHVRQHTGDRPFVCTACDYSTRDHNTLRRHMMRHTGVRQYHCNFCPYSAIQSQVFKHHLKKHHEGKGVFSCNTCSFTTLNEQVFTYHRHDTNDTTVNGEEDTPAPDLPNEKEQKTGPGELKQNLPYDEESNNFFDHASTIDTGGITIIEDGKDPSSKEATLETLVDLQSLPGKSNAEDDKKSLNKVTVTSEKWDINVQHYDSSTLFC